MVACRNPAETTAPPAASDAADRAERLLAQKTLPERFVTVALADELAVSSTAAGLAGPDRARRALLAARLRERLFRTAHAEADAREATLLYAAASADAEPSLRCDVGIARAMLLGEVARDPRVTSAALAELGGQKDVGGACLARIDARQAALAPFGRSAARPTTAPASDEPVPEEAVVEPPADEKPTGPATIRGIEAFSGDDGGRVVVRLDGVARFTVGTAGAEGDKGPRVFVDVAEAKLGKGKRTVPVAGNGLVTRVRSGRHDGGVRVVLDLAKKAYRRVFFLPDPFRIVIDVTSRPPRAGGAVGTAGQKREIARVVLDPGHGGHDAGAIGPSGLREKDVTLDIAHRAAPVIAHELGASTLLTRDDDTFVSLDERTARANAFGADVFVSIHCNANESQAARGVTTYVVDTTSDTVAARVAARENGASADVPARLLADLRLADLGARSTHLADLLQRSAVASLDKFPGTVDQGVKTAGFFVLVGAQMPSVLFETSFISNPTEEERLGSGEYRQKLADAIVNALRAYRDGR